jgi:hypothetical protein
MGYAIPAYVADMVTLLARLDAEHGGLGRHLDGRADRPGLAALPGSPLRRLVLNDVGPGIEPAALQRIGTYLGAAGALATLDEAPTRCGPSRRASARTRASSGWR